MGCWVEDTSRQKQTGIFNNDMKELHTRWLGYWNSSQA